jgi:hypothetical protein
MPDADRWINDQIKKDEKKILKVEKVPRHSQKG